MNCEPLKILNYLEGLLPNELLETHIAICPTCQKLIEEYTLFSAQFKELSTPPFSTFYQELRRQIETVKKRKQKRRRYYLTFGTISLAAAILLLFLLKPTNYFKEPFYELPNYYTDIYSLNKEEKSALLTFLSQEVWGEKIALIEKSLLENKDFDELITTLAEEEKEILFNELKKLGGAK